MSKKKNKKNPVNIKPPFLLALCFVLLLCGGCSNHQSERSEKKYTADELNHLAQLEVYLPDGREPEKIIRSDEILYQYNHCFPSESASDTASYSEEQQEEWKKTAAGAAEKYRIVSYRYPVSRFHKGELEKNMTITIYEDTCIIKTEISEESIKSVPVPEEYLTFYFECSKEEMAFYHSLLEE